VVATQRRPAPRGAAPWPAADPDPEGSATRPPAPCPRPPDGGEPSRPRRRNALRAAATGLPGEATPTRATPAHRARARCRGRTRPPGRWARAVSSPDGHPAGARAGPLRRPERSAGRAAAVARRDSAGPSRRPGRAAVAGPPPPLRTGAAPVPRAPAGGTIAEAARVPGCPRSAAAGADPGPSGRAGPVRCSAWPTRSMSTR
jgi:hypothetical protein